MKKKTDYKRSRKQDIMVNAASIVIASTAVLAIIINTYGKSSEEAEKDINNAQMAAVEVENITKEIAGVPFEQPSKTETAQEQSSAETETVTLPETSAEEETVKEEQTTAQPVFEVVSKEYNNVAAGKLTETSYVNDDYFEDTLFLGDSRIVGMVNNGFLNENNAFAIIGINHVTYLSQIFTDRKTGVTGTIFDIVSVRKPKRIYVELGVNGVAFIDKNTFMAKYEELINRLMWASPESTIVIQSIMPVNEATYTGGNKNLNNANIDALNVQLLNLAESKGIYYLDLTGALKNEYNQLNSPYDSGDGLHYSFTGYSVVYDAICRHGVD